MPGVIQQVSISPGGIPKRAIAEGRITSGGLDGDDWRNITVHGGPDQALLLIAGEALDLLRTQGYPVYPGALGENLTTRGLDVQAWRPGQTYRAGTARLQFTKVRAPCRTLNVYGSDLGKAIFDAAVKNGNPTSPKWAISGFYARVLTEGIVRAGDPLELESELA